MSSTQFQIRSEGELSFDTLKITSENFHDPSVNAVGEVFLQLKSQELSVVGNNLTTFTLFGEVDNLNINLASGDGKLNARDLVANNVSVFHRGTNLITLNPINELSAELRSTGNVLVVNTPPVMDIEEYYTGRVIFE